MKIRILFLVTALGLFVWYTSTHPKVQTVSEIVDTSSASTSLNSIETRLGEETPPMSVYSRTAFARAMKKERNFLCKDSTEAECTPSEFKVFEENFGKHVPGREPFDPVARRDYLMLAAQPETARAIANWLQFRDENSEGYLKALLTHNMDTWRFTWQELGIPPDVWEQVRLHD